MQLRLWAAVLIFAGSYFPLSLILLAQDYNFDYLARSICVNIFYKNSSCVIPFEHARVSLSIFAFCLFSLILSLIIFRITKTKRTANIISAKYIPTELMNYTLPYIVSFMGVGYNEESKFLGIIIFLAWIFWITHKSGQIILNPILIVFGWRLYDVTFSYDGDQTKQESFVLSKREITGGDVVSYGNIQDVMIVRK